MSSPLSNADISADTLPEGVSTGETPPPQDDPEEDVTMEVIPTDEPTDTWNDDPVETLNTLIATENELPPEHTSTEPCTLSDLPADPSISETLPTSSTQPTNQTVIAEAVAVIEETAVDNAEVTLTGKRTDEKTVLAESRSAISSEDQPSLVTSTPVVDLQATTNEAASTLSDFIPLRDTPLSSIADPEYHMPSSDSDTGEEKVFPNVPQDLSTLELTSQFDQEDLTESHHSYCPNKSTPTLITAHHQLTPSALHEDKRDFVPCTKLGELLQDIPVPTTQGGWSSKGALHGSLPGTDLNLLMNEDSSMPKVFLCGESGVEEGVADCGEQDSSKEENVDEVCEYGFKEKESVKVDNDKVERESEELRDQNDQQSDLSEEEDSSDQSEVEEDVTSSCGSSVNTKATPVFEQQSVTIACPASSPHQVEIFIPDVPCEVSPPLSQQPRKIKLSKSRKNSRSVMPDPSPVVVDLRPQTGGKRKAVINRKGTPYPKKVRMNKFKSGENSSLPVEAISSTPETVKKGELSLWYYFLRIPDIVSPAVKGRKQPSIGKLQVL